MKHEESISADMVDQIIKYDQETGVFFWKHRNGFSIGDNIFNSRYADKVAGSINKHGYWRIILNEQYVQAHRLAFFVMTGKWPSNQIDHINGVRHDNRWCNLREATLCENARNSCRPINNRSGFKGVSWKERNQKWVAQISIGNRKKHVGLFETAVEAHQAYMRAARVYHGEFARAA